MNFRSSPARREASWKSRHDYATTIDDDAKPFLFEQSLDIYRPNNDNCCRNDLVVLLTVGSGWMGHCPWVYRPTAWWNAAGPRTVAAALSCPCVCIRHRGAYVALPDWCTMWQYAFLPLVVAAAASGSVRWYNRRDKVDSHDNLWSTMAVVWTPFCLVVAACAFLKVTARGSASLDDMVDDVATAIAWVHKHPDKIFPRPADQSRQVVFGGYSSGGHVAATLLQRSPAYFQTHGLPPPHDMFAGILYISGVLAVVPPHHNDDNLTGRTIDSSRTSSSFSSHQEDAKDTASEPLVLIKDRVLPANHHNPTPPPVWLTNFVCRTVWGPQWRNDISSPLQQLDDDHIPNLSSITKIPHLVIENRAEVFGLTWLNVFFCGAAYQQRLAQLGVPVVLRQVDSDHWNILASRHLYEAVQQELPRLLSLSKPNESGQNSVAVHT